MTFSEYDLIKAQYTLTEQYNEIQLCFCADKEQTERVWQAPLSIKDGGKLIVSDSFYVLMIPKGLDFTEERYETLKGFFERYVKNEKVKEKLAKLNKDFV
jgi:hypothetical protein